MKKIILIMLLVVCFTACGNKEVKNDIEVNNLPNEESTEIISNQVENTTKDNESEVKINNTDEVTENIVDKVEEDVNKNSNSEEAKNELVEIPKVEEVKFDEGVEKGKKAIDFELELLSGEKVKLSDYLGKPVFLNFWATWCGPCVGEMPDIEKIKNEYGDKIAVLAINSGELKDDVKAFIDRKGYTFNVGINEKGDLLEIYDSMYIPLSVFIDENGIIKERSVGALSEENMRNIIEELIQN